jgi:hypothetical protein
MYCVQKLKIYSQIIHVQTCTTNLLISTGCVNTITPRNSNFLFKGNALDKILKPRH